MKYVLVLFMLFSVKANSQNINDAIPVGKIDTVRVRLLLSDTCELSSVFRVDYAFVITGYKVRIRAKYNDEPGTFCYECPNYWQHLVYLDERKRVIKDCIEVWFERPCK